MKLLEYKIAWIDDQPGQAKGYYENINNRLGRTGLNAKAEWISTSENLKAFLNKLRGDSDYDLIMVDWKLGKMVHDNQTGVSVAKKIRYQNSFATIIFYSAERPDVLQKEIASECIDGVFCVNRQYFVEEAMNIIKASTRRFTDLTAMRGLFLAAVAEFDSVIQDAVEAAYLGLSPTIQNTIKNRLIDRSKKFHSEKIESIQILDSNADLVTTLDHLRPGSKELADCLKEILSTTTPSSQHASALQKFSSYETEILVPRNDMAHVKESVSNGRRFLTRGSREWDATKFDQLRSTLRDHHENLKYILDPLIKQLIAYLNESPKADSKGDNK